MSGAAFHKRLAEVAQATQRLLEELLPHSDSAAAPRLAHAMRYATLGGGKRIRPFFVCESARLFDVDESRALHVAAALECVHCYSLVHDDLPAMDDDELRRGRPTLHVAFDEATAILAGDALLTLAFGILAQEATHPDAHVRNRLVAMLAEAAGAAGMVGGQMRDLQAEQEDITHETAIIAIQQLKTGALFRFALLAGAVLADAAEQDMKRLRTYADAIGLAFQIADDILDVEGSAQELGKTPGKDAAAGKATFVDLLGLKGARARACALVQEACAALEPYGARAELLRAAARFIIERRK